jgi:hypothetical protein
LLAGINNFSTLDTSININKDNQKRAIFQSIDPTPGIEHRQAYSEADIDVDDGNVDVETQGRTQVNITTITHS